MADSFSVKAILSAKDSGFSSTLKSCSSTLDSINDKISGFTFGMLTGAGQAAFSAISGGLQNLLGEAMETSDAMQKLQQAMRFSGESEKDIERIAGANGSLKTYADKTVFSLQDVMSTFGALSANGVKDADKLTESVGNAVAVFGGGANEFSSVALAFSQSMAAGKMNAQDWNQVLNASPQLAGGLKKELQKLSPVLKKDFKEGLEKGAITAELLGTAMNNIGMTDMAKEAASSVTTFEGAMGNLEATVSSGLMTLYDSFAKGALLNVINGLGEKIGTAFEKLSKDVPKVIEKIKPYAIVIKDTFTDIKDAVSPAITAILDSFKKLTGGFGSTDDVSNFKSVLQSVVDVIKKLAEFVTKHSDTIAKLIKYLPAIAIGIKGFSIAKAVIPGVMSFAGGIAKVASSVGSGLATKLFGVSKAEKAVGETSASTGDSMLKSAAAFLMMGAGVLMIALGFGILTQSAIALAGAGWGAIAVMGGMVIALVGLGIGIALLLETLAPMSGQLIAVGVAFALMGAAVLLIAAGLAIMASASISLANAGWGAVAVMVGMIAVVAILAIIVATLGTAMLAGAIGFLVFGAAVLLVGAGFVLMGVGALLAVAALRLLVGILPALSEGGASAALAILALGGALTVFAIGAGLAGIACVVLAAGIIVLSVALIALGAALIVLGAGALIAAAGFALFGEAAAVVVEAISGGITKVLDAIAGIFDSIGNAAKNAGIGFNLAAEGLKTIGKMKITSLVKSLTAVASGMKKMAKHGNDVLKTGTGMAAIASALQNISKSGMSAVLAMTMLTSTLLSTASKAVNAGKQIGEGFNSGIVSGLSAAPALVMASMIAVGNALESGKTRAVNAGRMISAGFAKGMLSQLSVVTAAANKLAEQADKAVRAKAKIKSPSRVADKLGSYWGEGFANGIADMAREVWAEAQNLVEIPNIATPNLAYAYAGELSSEYEYTRSYEYNITVVSEMDGKKVGEGCATYVSDSINRQQTRANRKRGKA